ncbi:hypothetical protein NPIL_409331 [Nephila pilipes]|uniref:Uncharacterized protein n=1 Tax=Nephila pilipes TaxID=299642 RepID=A0A8X6MZ03_NEPPI|nr:hypothetical protein NPIL_409331 [Nephila pilipes]
MWKQDLGDIEVETAIPFNVLIPVATIRDGSELTTAPSIELRTSEVYSLFLANMNTTWGTLPNHAWYAADSLDCPSVFLSHSI